MNQKLLAALLGVLLAAPLGALAQQSPRPPDPSDPAALVTPIVYESVLSRPTQAALDTPSTPDKVWRSANDAVAGSSEHAGHGAHQSGTAQDAGTRPAPTTPPTAVPVPARHPAPVDHSKHH